MLSVHRDRRLSPERRNNIGRTVSLALAPLCMVMIGGCNQNTGGTGSVRYRVAERLITDSSQPVLDRSELFGQEVVSTWRMESAADLSHWELQDLGSPRFRTGKMSIGVTGFDPRLERETSIEAADVDSVELRIAGLRKGRLGFSWAGPGEKFSDSNHISQTVPRATGRQIQPLRIDLAANPQWKGTVGRIQISIPADVGQRPIVESISWSRARRGERPLPAVMNREWKVELDHDARPAFPCPPGSIVNRELEIPVGGILSFSYGIDDAVDQPVTFTISIAGESGPFDAVFTDTLDPQRGQSGRWFSQTVDLSGRAPGPARLRFVTAADPSIAPGRSLAAFGSVEILAPEGQNSPPNVVVIVLDTLRADHLSCYGYSKTTSPNIDKWAEESAVLFENTVAQAPWTLPSHVSLFSGLDALRHGTNQNQPASRSLTMMAETLAAAGYTTSAFTGGGYLRPSFGLDQGFDNFRFWPSQDHEGEIDDGISRTLTWLERHRDRRFFLFFHTYEVHGPHHRHEPFFADLAGAEERSLGTVNILSRKMPRANLQDPGDYYVAIHPRPVGEVKNLTDEEKVLLSTMYDSAIASADDQNRRLLDRIRSLGLEDDTMVILTSDHGEALGESDRAGHHYLNDYNVMVPLIIAFPDRLACGRRITTQVRLIDVLPTVEASVGVPEGEPLDGVSLLPMLKGHETEVPEEAWTYSAGNNLGVGLRFANRLKYTFNNAAWARIVGREELYDLQEDPGEEHDISDRDPLTEDLRRRTEAAILGHHSGLRLTLRNDGPGSLGGTIGGALRSMMGVKSVDPDFRGLRWSNHGLPTFEINAGDEITLLFDSISGSQAAIQGTYTVGRNGVRHRFDESIDLDAIGEGFGLTLTRNGWTRAEDRGAVTTGFWLWNSGRFDAGDEDDLDPEVEAQLRALGYVDE